jgi:hypothetical protein
MEYPGESLRIVRVVSNKYSAFTAHFFLIRIVGRVESNWVHSALRPLTGLFCQPQVIIIKEKLAELLAGETESTRTSVFLVAGCHAVA